MDYLESWWIFLHWMFFWTEIEQLSVRDGLAVDFLLWQKVGFSDPWGSFELCSSMRKIEILSLNHEHFNKVCCILVRTCYIQEQQTGQIWVRKELIWSFNGITVSICSSPKGVISEITLIQWLSYIHSYITGFLFLFKTILLNYWKGIWTCVHFFSFSNLKKCSSYIQSLDISTSVCSFYYSILLGKNLTLFFHYIARFLFQTTPSSLRTYQSNCLTSFQTPKLNLKLSQ